MADIAKSVGKYIAEKVGQQLGYVISYESNIDNLIAEVKRLEEAKDIIYHSVEAATRNGELIELMAKNWLEKVDAIVTEAEEFQKNEGHAKAECSCGHFPNLWARHQLSMKAKEIAKDIPGVIKDGEKITKVSYPPRVLVGIASPYARGYKALDSRTSILNQIMQTLMDPHVCKVGLWGMGGVGKSTLVKELAWKAVKYYSFGTVVSVELTESPDVKTIQVKIAESLGMKKFDVETLEARASRLHERICKEENILIIMDNIWERLDLIEVGVPFGDDHKGSKLLFTSRDLNILTQEMGVQEQFCFKLEVLSEEESWSLFEKQVGDALKDNKIQPIVLEVAKACCGLPLLLSTVANTLKNKRLPAWDDAFQQLTRFNHEDLAAKMYLAIELSYNHLANDELKSLFLLLGSMGQATIWKRDVLTDLWSLGLFKNVDSLARARNRFYYLVTELKSACLLLEEGDENEFIKMHDVVHEVARILASKDRPIFVEKQYSELKEWPKIDKKCYRMFVSECHIHDLPKSLECPELEILKLGSQNNFLKVPDNFLAETKELKCVYLSGLDCVPSLASFLCHLPNLCALHLCECMLEDIAILAELKNLEILDFNNSEIRELPAAIGNLTRLRLLCLSNVSGLRAIPAKILSSLTNLEELYIGNTFIQWEDDEIKGNNASLGELRHLHQLTILEVMIQDASVLPENLFIFGQLNKYRIFIGYDCGWSYGNLTISKTLKLTQGKTKKIQLDKEIKLLLSNVEDLGLNNVHGVSSVLYQLNEEGFPQLKHLDLQSSDDIHYIIDSKEWHHSCEAFPKLESLFLYNLPNMRKICNGPLPVQSFTELKVIKVKSCDQLENVFSYSLIKDLPSLLELEISQCKVMSKIIIKEDAEIDKIEFPRLHSITLDYLPILASFCSKRMATGMELRSMIEYEDDSTTLRPLFDEKISFPNLDDLKISSINLTKIWGEKLSQHSYIQKLKSLTIDDCHNLRFLFSSSVTRGLVNLQHLSISGCELLEEIFSTEEKIVNLPSDAISLSNQEVVFPSLETLVVSDMDSLKTIWNNQMASNSFPKLTRLGISFCNKLTNIVSSYVPKHLETMTVVSCDSLEVVFDMEKLNSCSLSQHGLTAQLKTLTLANLPKLKRIWSKGRCRILGFQNLCTVEISDCQGLNHVFPLSVGMELKNLQVLTISSSGIKHIVVNEEKLELAPKFVLPKLETLRFRILPKLRNFGHEIQTLECPNLKELDVTNCGKLEIFAKESLICQDILVDVQPLFSFEKVIQSVENLTLSRKDIMFICNDQQSDVGFYHVKSLLLQHLRRNVEFPTNFLQRFTNLEELTLYSCSYQSIPHIEHEVISNKLKSLTLHSLWHLENICQENSQMEQFVQNLQTLKLIDCRSLLSIAPSHARFQYLSTLWVGYCDELENIISSRTARGLPALQNLVISNCNMIEEIVVSEDEDTSEIAFMKLEFLQLQGLPSLTSFSNGNLLFKFPLLKTLHVIECPMMETFSRGIIRAPSLKAVSVTPEGDELLWKCDLNTTIEIFFTQQHSEEV